MLRVIDSGGSPSEFLPEGLKETPLVEAEGIFIKLECVNPCGSVKDRIAAYIIQESKNSGLLQPGQPIIEATSGNTGIALSYYGRMAGHPVTIVMPEHMTQERKDLIELLGAELILCSKEGSFAEAASIRDRLATDRNAFNPDQFSNALNVECHYKTTGAEIIRQVGEFVDPGATVAFVAGVGTGGTLVGAGAALKEWWPNVQTFAVEPLEAAVITGGANGPHGIGGIGDGFIPEIASDGAGGLHPIIDGVEVVSTEEAVSMAQRLSQVHSICIGASSGANFVAAKRLQQRFDVVITVFPDGHQKYHSAGIEPPEEQKCPFCHFCEKSTLGKLLSVIDRR